MQLAKPRVDIGLSTNHLEPMLAFWQNEAGVPFDHLLPIRPGQDQHRHDANGSVLKINHHAEPLPANPPAGYRELIIAREGLTAPRHLADPEGNRVSLVPPGWQGVRQVGVRIAVRDLAAHRRFYREALELPEEEPERTPGRFRAGETLIILEEDPSAPVDAAMQGPGWRYITFQVFKVDEEHAKVLARGGREALAPVTLGSTARISMVRDPDGNWIELSQRASIVGSLE
ncbi:VOC family protein [Phenylobacterium soli]|uniref:VOC family protein n=1 Tax=Phenylobacterium soli TaxID=2170551 RepID=A0A328AF38_9CAUL|nr:VOC family protein [Phenylobacterium soli]RAK53137.1 VOC family protein [Phenylobacterium soli]